jgi:uncharacterized metal-binding protein
MNRVKYSCTLFDFLGYPIALNFDKKGSSHKTIIGGILSVIFLVFTIFYTSLGIIKIVN